MVSVRLQVLFLEHPLQLVVLQQLKLLLLLFGSCVGCFLVSQELALLILFVADLCCLIKLGFLIEHLLHLCYLRPLVNRANRTYGSNGSANLSLEIGLEGFNQRFAGCC